MKLSLFSRLLRISGCALVAMAGLPVADAALLPPAPDPSFGGSGQDAPGSRSIAFPGAHVGADSMALQADGSIVVGGFQGPGPAAGGRILLARLRATDGLMDTTFGNGGRVVTDLGTALTSRCMAVQADGRILVAGMDQPAASIRVGRFLVNGAVDPSFGVIGASAVPAPSSCVLTKSLAVQSNGRILLCGRALEGGAPVTRLWRLMPDGQPDESFGPGGARSMAGPQAADILVLPGDKILLAGSLPDPDRLWLTRLQPGGTVDAAFGEAGAVIVNDEPGFTTRASCVIPQSDGKMVAGGSFTVNNVRHFLVHRFTADGAADTTFGTGGRVKTAVYYMNASGFLVSDFIQAIAVQSDGRIVACGTGDQNGPALVRYLPGGSLDLNFGSGGIFKSAPANVPHGSSAMLLQPDGKLLASGTVVTFSDSLMVADRLLLRDGLENLSVERPQSTVLTRGQTIFIPPVPAGSPTPVTVEVWLRNTGPSAITGLSGAFEQQGAGGPFDFATLLPAVIGAGASASFVVRFTPPPGQSAASFEQVLTLRNTGPDASDFTLIVHAGTSAPVATLTVSETGPLLTTGAAVDFGVTRPSAPVTRVFTLRNEGNIPLDIQGLTFASEGTPDDFTAGPPDASVLAPGVSTTLPVTFTPRGTGPRSGRLRIATTDTFNPPFELNLTGALAPGFDAWRYVRFGTVLNEGDAADLGDPDHDGIPNLLEYATFADPATSGPAAGELTLNGTTLEYRISIPSLASLDLTCALEWSDNPHLSWSPAPGPAAVISDNGILQRLLFTLPTGESGHRCVRFRVTRK